MKPQIVLDSNVLVAALKSSKGTSYRLLAMVDSGAYQLQISTTLVAEYEAVLKREAHALTAQQVDDVLDYLCACGVHHKIYYLWRPVLKDPGDDFVLELAVKSQARIVTWNTADFRRAASLGVVVQTPRDFLKELWDRPSALSPTN